MKWFFSQLTFWQVHPSNGLWLSAVLAVVAINKRDSQADTVIKIFIWLDIHDNFRWCYDIYILINSILSVPQCSVSWNPEQWWVKSSHCSVVNVLQLREPSCLSCQIFNIAKSLKPFFVAWYMGKMFSSWVEGMDSSTSY